ncbi:MAG TPA: sigma-70 family RNA polymerase sigma factor [Gemmatimonadaceae bacterium]|jgi:RNA polymerase sigma-70 factor (ECF subfamily)
MGVPHLTDQISPAIEAVLMRFSAMVRRIGIRHGLSESDVDEVFQEVRIRLWRARGEGSNRALDAVPAGPVAGEQISSVGSSYLYRTAVSAALDVLRRHRRPREDALEDVGQEPSAPSRRQPEQSLESSELAQQVARAIDTITPSRRPVVRMYLAGYTREEIAGLLGWSEAKTRNLLYRGLADLRERLTEQGIGPEAVA